MFRVSYWVLPIISGVVWLATLLGLLIYWSTAAGRPHYPSMQSNQTIAYISDVGAYKLKPLFVTGSVLTTIFLDLSFAADRWLRHKGRLVPNGTLSEKILSGLTIAFAVVGTVGLICLSIFDTFRHSRLHLLFLGLFMGGYVISAIFICWEYQRLGIHNREHTVLAVSFWIKLVFVCVEIILAICFGVLKGDRAAVIEWAIAFIFSLYVFSFYIDLYPAVRTKGVRNAYGASGYRGATSAGRGWGRGGKKTAGFGFEKRGMPTEPPMAHMGDAEHGYREERYRG